MSSKKLQASISAMADLFEHGQLMAETDPAQFIDEAATEIRESRARIVTLEAALRGLCEAYDAQVTVRNTVLFNHACPQSAGAWRAALAVLKEPKS